MNNESWLVKMRRWKIRKWLRSRGWIVSGYPFPEGHPGCQYLVYWHPDIHHSNGSLEYAVELEKKRESSVG